MTHLPLKIDQIDEGYVVLISGLLIVFTALLTLSLFFKFVMPKMLYVYKIITKGKDKKIKDISAKTDKEFTGEKAAAIAMAIYMYLNDQHDNENAILTIRTARKLYSPWSSKIYGVQNKP